MITSDFLVTSFFKMEIKIVLEKQEGGGFTVYVPSLSGCISQGETVEESLKNIKEAIELYLETSIEDIEQKGKIMEIEV